MPPFRSELISHFKSVSLTPDSDSELSDCWLVIRGKCQLSACADPNFCLFCLSANGWQGWEDLEQQLCIHSQLAGFEHWFMDPLWDSNSILPDNEFNVFSLGSQVHKINNNTPLCYRDIRIMELSVTYTQHILMTQAWKYRANWTNVTGIFIVSIARRTKYSSNPLIHIFMLYDHKLTFHPRN